MNLLIGIIIGFIISEIISGRTPGKTRFFRSWKIFYKDRIVHIHHWMWSLTLLLILLLLEFNNLFILGIILGICIQGLTYKNFYKIIYKHA